MIEELIEVCARHRALTLFIFLLGFIGGLYSYKSITIDAIPDLSDTQVIVYANWNVSPDIIEDQVTYPVVTSLLGVPKVKDIRGLSVFGASYVYAIFEDGTDIYWARSRVLEYLGKIQSELPKGVQLQLGPDATGVGWIYQYALKDISGRHSLADLRSYQDWFLRYQLQSIPGVSEVASFGGYEREYQVSVKPQKLQVYGVTMKKLGQALRAGNQEVGARVMEFSGAEYMVRGRGYAKSVEDIENIVVDTSESGTPVYVKNLASVFMGPALRRGTGDLNGLGDTVGGIVVMRHGENARNVIGAIESKLSDLTSSLPEGIEIVETYNRKSLINRAVKTLNYELIIEILVVALVILLFLRHLPSALVPVLSLPLAVILSFIGMRLFGVSANIMSLGGIAIAIGAMVDAAIVVVENVRKKMEHCKGDEPSDKIASLVVEAVKEVGPASFYSLLVIAVSFLPIFVLGDQEGRLFKPLAYTKTLAMMVAAFVSVTFVPALLIFIYKWKVQSGEGKWSYWIHRVHSGGFNNEAENPLSQKLFKYYGPVVHWVVEHPKKVIGLSLLALLMTIPIFFKLGSEFMPPLNEGTILYMPTTMPGLSIGEAQRLLRAQDEILKSFPEVKSVHGKAGRAGTATDPAPISMMETVVVLKDPSQWRKKDRWYSFLPEVLHGVFSWVIPNRISWEELVAEMDKKMQFPGLTNAWTMPIKTRIDMLTTGIRTPVGIKVSGGELSKLADIGKKLEKILSKVEGARSVFAERVSEAYFLDIEFQREALARHGISIAQAQESLTQALGGEKVTTLIRGRERYGVQLRYARAFRQNVDDVKHILVTAHGKHQVPLGDVAIVKKNLGPGVLRNENGLLTEFVYVDLNTSDIGGFVERAKKAVEDELKLPPGYSLNWSGQFENIQRVRERLVYVLPITLLLIVFLVFLNTGSGMKTAIILCAIPFSAIGAIWFLYLLDYNMSVAVWVGIIALVGVDAETAIFMLLYLDLAYSKNKASNKMNNLSDLKESIYEGAVHRIRPKVMTVLTTFLALLPIMLASSSATGADVMKRMAAPMVGGLFSSFLMELLVYPAIFLLWKRKEVESF